MADKKDLLDQTSAELKATVDEAMTAVAAIKAGLGATVSLTKEDRKGSLGRFRDGEPDALEGALDVAEANPAAFKGLASSDGGNDPAVFETELLRDRLRAASLLGALATEFESVARNIRDTQLQLGAEVRGPVLAAYEIAKVLARHDPKAKSTLAKAIDFYAFDKRKKTQE
jgi:hypothetical protein